MARAVASGGKAFYTTPIKALSNQKFHDLVERHGRDGGRAADRRQRHQRRRPDRGDDHRGAAQHDLQPVAGARRPALRRARRGALPAGRLPGPVWEEVIIHLPPEVRLVCLSATVSNASELAEWISTVRGPTTTVLETERPIELANLYMVGERGGEQAVTDPDPGRRPAQPRRRPVRRGGPSSRTRAAATAVVHPPPARGHRPACASASCCRRSTSSSAGPPATTRCRPASTPGCGSPSTRSDGASARSSRATWPPSATTTSPSSATTGSGRARGGPGRAPRRDGARRSRRRSRPASWTDWSRSCSPPRPSPSASTCRPAPW